jgi:hypothetical protein
MKKTKQSKEEPLSKFDQEILDLERKLNLKGSKDKSLLKDLEEDGLMDIFNLNDDLDREYESYLNAKKGKKVKSSTLREDDLKDNYAQEENEDQYNEEEQDEFCEEAEQVRESMDFSKVEYVLARLTPLKHLKSLLESFRNSSESSQLEVLDELSRRFFSADKPIQKKSLLMLLIIKGFIESKNIDRVIHVFYKNLSVAMNNPQNTNLVDYIGYAYLFKVITADFMTSCILKLVAEREFKKAGAVISLVGLFLRKESAKAISEIGKAIEENSIDNNDFRYAQSILKKIRLNQTIEVTHPENYNKYKTASKTLEKRHQTPKETFRASLDSLLASDFNNSSWYAKFYEAPQENKLSGKHNELIQKYEQTLEKLSLEVLNQKLIAASIFEAENYMEAAEKIFKLKIFRSHYNDIPHTIFVLINSEGKFNPYYVYLSHQITNLMTDLEFSFYKYIWNFFKDLMTDVDQRKLLYVIKFVTEAWKMGFLDFKLLKNLDFATIHKNQKIFNKLLFKGILKSLSVDFIAKNIEKYFKSSKAALMADEVQTFASKYRGTNFEKDFVNENNTEEVQEKLDLFENMV